MNYYMRRPEALSWDRLGLQLLSPIPKFEDARAKESRHQRRGIKFGAAQGLTPGLTQTVLKTGGMASRDVHRGRLQFDFAPADSMTICRCPLVSATLAVFLAVNNRSRLSDARALHFDMPTSRRGGFELLLMAALGNSR